MNNTQSSEVSLVLSADYFFERINKLYKQWREYDENDCEALIFLNGKEDEKAIKIKTETIQCWLFEILFIDTLIVFSKKNITLIFGQKKFEYINHFKPKFENNEIKLNFLVKEKENISNFTKVFEIIRADSNNSEKSLKLGGLPKEKQYGPFVAEFDEFLKTQDFVFHDISNFVQELYCVKDEKDLDKIRKAAKSTCFFETKLLNEVEKYIDEETKISHLDISSKIEGLLNNTATINLLEKKHNINKAFLDLSYSPVIQSGGNYDLRAVAVNNKDNLTDDTIICMCGTKYFYFNANAVRTLFIEPTKDQKANYLIILELRDKILENLKPGKKINEIYEIAINFLKEKAPHLIEKMGNYLGFGIGLEFKENNILINAKNVREIKENMTLNLCFPFSGLKSEKDKNYAIMIADTIIVKATQNEILTNTLPIKYKDVSYALENQDNEETTKKEDKKTESKENKPKNISQSEDVLNFMERKLTRNATNKKDDQLEQKRKEHQKQLLKLKQEELEERLKSGSFSQGFKKTKNLNLGKLKAYNSISEVPKEFRKNQINIDVARQSVLLPIGGRLIPFHISVIKNVSRHDEGKISSVRFNFHVPGTSINSNITFPEMNKEFNDYLYVRELTFRSADTRKMNDIVKKIKDLQKKTKLEYENNKENLIEQESLNLIKGKKPVLTDLKIRPNISGKKSSGTLEAHLNGFRYITTKNERIDITFSNIKHAFFQPCNGEMIVLLHFHLHTPILVGKSKTEDVQFFTEAGIQVEYLDVRRKTGYDEDEIEEEERERAQRKKLNLEFEQFVKTVEQLSKEKIMFDIPYKNLGFYGTPHRSHVFLQPTVHCLVNLTERPFFIMEMDEVEVSNFERIQYGLRNFDLNFIFKNYDKPVIRISTIPIDSLEPIKNWLDKMDILYSETKINMDWNEVLREIKGNLQGFVEDGGWAFLQDDLSNENSEEEKKISNPDDSEYQASDIEEEESEYSSEDDLDEEEDDDDDEEEENYEEEEEDEEEEEEEEDSEEERRRKRKK